MPLHSLATVGKPKMAGEAEDTMLTGWARSRHQLQSAFSETRWGENLAAETRRSQFAETALGGDCLLECREMGLAEATYLQALTTRYGVTPLHTRRLCSRSFLPSSYLPI